MRLLGFANARVYHCHSYGIIFKSLLNHAVEVYFGGTAMSQLQPDISSLLKEDRVFTPSSSFSADAHIKSREDYDRISKRSIEDPEGFWSEIAGELHWFKKWDKVLAGNEPFAKWFVGRRTSVSYNCLDRHLSTWRKNKAAIIGEGGQGDMR